MNRAGILIVGSWIALNAFWTIRSIAATSKALPHDQSAIDRAMSSAEAAASRAEKDPTRPLYHVLAPANWMNDPNGPIYHQGYYHLFYQHNPYGDEWGHMHWGHVRSRDLVYWERLPIALWPSKEAGEEHVFSGCATINGTGQPIIFYTSIGRGQSATDHAEQWAAVSDDAMLVWRKHPENPMLSLPLHGNVPIYDWRDPFIFREKGQTFLVLGGNLNRGKGGRAVVNLYQAENAELTRWKYLGVLFTHPDPKVSNIECPNFFKLDGRWLLVVSPHRKVEYFVGRFDTASHEFRSEQSGTLDYGNYYAPNCLLDPKGRRIMWGWVNGFKQGLGWNGCLTVPRVLSLTRDGQLRQKPAPELKRLRSDPFALPAHRLTNSMQFIEQVKGDALEIAAEIEPGDAKSLGLTVRRSVDRKRGVTISFDGQELDVAGVKAPLGLPRGERSLRLHVFLDRSVMEVFANDRACITRVIESDPAEQGIELFVSGGTAKFRSLNIWALNTIW